MKIINMAPKPDKDYLKTVLPEKLKKNQSALRFFSRFDRVCKCLEWEDDAKQASQVLLLFGDDVFDYCETLDETTLASYKLLKKKVLEFVDGGDLGETYVRNFQSMKWSPGEDVATFMGRMKEVERKAYPDLDDNVREALLLKQFVVAMPSEVRKQIYLSADKPTNPSEMVDACKLYIQLSVPAEKGACAKLDIEGSKMDKLLQRMEELSVDVANLKAGSGPQPPVMAAIASGSRRGRSFNGTCYKCSQFGHLARNCPSSRQSSVCSVCGNEGHASSECALKSGDRCRKCGNTGHREFSCKLKGTGLNWQ